MPVCSQKFLFWCNMKFLWLAVFLFVAGCTGNVAVSPGTTDSTRRNDTTTMTLDTFQQTTKSPIGFYGATLPCANCKGIEHTVFFNPDLTFRLEEARLGTKELTKTEGRWQAVEGKIFLYKNDTVKARYTWQADTLYYLDEADRLFALRTLPAAGNNPSWKERGERGTLFFGTGTEPFWSIEVDKKNGLSFHLAEWKTPKTFKPSVPVTAGDSTVYSSKSDSSSLRVTISSAFCSDGMSDFIYTNKVRVVYNGQVYLGCGLLYKDSSVITSSKPI